MRLLFYFLLCLPFLSQAQEKVRLGERIILGNSITYIWENDPDVQSIFREYTWNKDIAVSVFHNLYVGIQHKNIWTAGSVIDPDVEVQHFSMLGAFAQLDVTGPAKKRLFVELSLNRGNYCTCGDGDPFKNSDLNYVGAGLGLDIPFHNYFSVDFSFLNYWILNDIEDKYNYTQYVIGLNFDLIRSRK